MRKDTIGRVNDMVKKVREIASFMQNVYVSIIEAEFKKLKRQDINAVKKAYMEHVRKTLLDLKDKKLAEITLENYPNALENIRKTVEDIIHIIRGPHLSSIVKKCVHWLLSIGIDINRMKDLEYWLRESLKEDPLEASECFDRMVIKWNKISQLLSNDLKEKIIRSILNEFLELIKKERTLESFKIAIEKIQNCLCNLEEVFDTLKKVEIPEDFKDLVKQKLLEILNKRELGEDVSSASAVIREYLRALNENIDEIGTHLKLILDKLLEIPPNRLNKVKIIELICKEINVEYGEITGILNSINILRTNIEDIINNIRFADDAINKYTHVEFSLDIIQHKPLRDKINMIILSIGVLEENFSKLHSADSIRELLEVAEELRGKAKEIENIFKDVKKSFESLVRDELSKCPYFDKLEGDINKLKGLAVELADVEKLDDLLSLYEEFCEIKENIEKVKGEVYKEIASRLLGKERERKLTLSLIESIANELKIDEKQFLLELLKISELELIVRRVKYERA